MGGPPKGYIRPTSLKVVNKVYKAYARSPPGKSPPVMALDNGLRYCTVAPQAANDPTSLTADCPNRQPRCPESHSFQQSLTKECASNHVSLLIIIRGGFLNQGFSKLWINRRQMNRHRRAEPVEYLSSGTCLESRATYEWDDKYCNLLRPLIRIFCSLVPYGYTIIN